MTVFIKRFLIFISCVFISSICVNAQTIGLNDLKNTNVSSMSNEEIKLFIENFRSQGYNLGQIEEAAKENGMPASEWQKLRARIMSIESAEKRESYSGRDDYEYIEEVGDVRDDTREAGRIERGVPVFGSSLFNRSGLTFEPNLRLPTPENYILGPGDELNIEIYGYSENTVRTTVSTDGYIKIPAVGMIQVSGLTIDQARKVIRSKLYSVYYGLHSGETGVSITLGNIRSIKVLMVGEVYRPGTYTLPSVASAFNALNASGGPNRNGSFRNIKVIRNNNIIAVIDIYDFLKTGIIKNNVTLQDQDVIRIEPYGKRIEIEGEVKTTGYFEATGNETLADIISFAGGFTTSAYKDNVTILRNTDKERSVSDVPLSSFDAFVLQDGDIFSVGKLLDRFTNRVQIEGAVFRPGTYSMEAGLTLRKLIEKADGLREDAFPDRGLIVREKADMRKEMVAFNVADIMSGAEPDIVLRREDVVTIRSVLSMKEKETVAIYGEVKNQGEYDMHENMTLKDLIFSAGGFKDRAELRNVEIIRLVKDPDVLKQGKEQTKQFIFTVDQNLNFSSGGDEFKLENMDQVVVRMMSGYMDIQSVIVEGEVIYPGNYTIASRGDKISDIIKRAGGLNSFAYPQGAFLIRTIGSGIADAKLDKEVYEGVSSEAIINRREFFRTEGVVGINLDKILAQPGSKWDILLEGGDIIRIPRMLQTVQVTGEVLLPSHVVYDPSISFKKFIKSSGGYTSDALRRKSFVVYANGTAKATGKIFFINNYPEIEPGSQIYVPRKPPRREGMSFGESVRTATSTTATLTSLAAIIFSIFKK